jgi:deazaflavin-dependent oxidoreductase (nitroreductase family)
MFHIILALRFLPADIGVLRRGQSLSFPPWLFNWLNKWFTRLMGSRQNRASLAAEYDKRHRQVIALMDTIEPREWHLAGDYPDINRNLRGRQTIADMFHYITVHFQEHAADIRFALEQPGQDGQEVATATTPAVQARRRPPHGLSRILFRAPLILYRLGLGPLLGGRFLLLHHVGRKSGLTRQAVLEVVDYDRQSGTYYIASGFGRGSQWFKNVQANPRVTIQVGSRRLKAQAEVLDPQASADKMVDYARRHPAAATGLARVLGFDVDGSEEDYRRVARQHIPFVALHVRSVQREKPTTGEVAAMAIVLTGVILLLVALLRRLRTPQTRAG